MSKRDVYDIMVVVKPVSLGVALFCMLYCFGMFGTDDLYIIDMEMKSPLTTGDLVLSGVLLIASVFVYLLSSWLKEVCGDEC